MINLLLLTVHGNGSDPVTKIHELFHSAGPDKFVVVDSNIRTSIAHPQSTIVHEIRWLDDHDGLEVKLLEHQPRSADHMMEIV